MAQNQWINATVDPAMTKKPDNSDHRHSVSSGTAAANDVTVSWDSAKITSQSQLRSVVAAILAKAAGGLPL